MTKPKPMKSWGDLNAALNHLVRDGVIDGYRTNRHAEHAEPAIVLILSRNMKEVTALHAVCGLLTGGFAGAAITVEVVD